MTVSLELTQAMVEESKTIVVENVEKIVIMNDSKSPAIPPAEPRQDDKKLFSNGKPPPQGVKYRVEYLHAATEKIVHSVHTNRLDYELVDAHDTTSFSQSGPLGVEQPMKRIAPIVTDTRRKIDMHIHSQAVIHALRSVVRYYPGQSLMGETVVIPAPYMILVHHEKELNEYKERCHPSNLKDPICPRERDAFHDISLVQEFLEQRIMPKVRLERERNMKGLETFDMISITDERFEGERSCKDTEILEDKEFEEPLGERVKELVEEGKCIAEYTKRPLMILTSSDIGASPERIESILSDGFKTASSWGAVLLIDEADVFMERRSTNDLNRNVLVAGFLRALEFYDGILFLTTNRVGAFDDAFISRIHVKLYYPEFTDSERQRVWQTFIDKLARDRGQSIRVSIDAKEFIRGKAMREVRWNGREIRNAFQTAVALAEYEDVRDEEGRVVLTDGHLRSIVDMSRSFKRYLDETHGADEEKRAAMEGDV
ncbi:hypothetical protein M7I_6382 [Glarea lozoyensis 74030]|uniref:Uncharacterized protein n=1 Tax=Glarea lozoyensis (strain ATCC 74030 / MF5533) TaxID=1104152 RepID=H0EUE8_GLAL7|nr:hypothetical protein M7I_6382 [Glarea lozoyensis 74030]